MIKGILFAVTLLIFSCQHGAPTTPILGDINNDGVVDQDDVSELSVAYGSVEGNLSWKSEADLNEDGKVEVRDYLILIDLIN